jgi:methyl coenzyme M reductase subunit C-like uncharacterized protein (methanogenesis marker protein 7)
VGPRRLEPRNMLAHEKRDPLKVCGGPGGIRTRDLPVARAIVLRTGRSSAPLRAYQAELPAQRIVGTEVTCPLIAVSREA